MSSPSLKLHDDAWISSPLRRRPSEITVEFVDEKLISQCMSCNTMFTAVVRKHHCVACGKVYCGKCSKVRAHSEQGVLLRQRFCVLCEEQCASRSIISRGNQMLLSKQRASPPRKQSAAPPVMALAGSKTIQRRKSGSCSCSIHIQQPISATAVLCTIKPKRKTKRGERPVMAEVHQDAESYNYSTGGEESSRSVSPAQRSGCTTPTPAAMATALAMQVNDSMVSQDEVSGLDSSALDLSAAESTNETSVLGGQECERGAEEADDRDVIQQQVCVRSAKEDAALSEASKWTRQRVLLVVLAGVVVALWALATAAGVTPYGHGSSTCSSTPAPHARRGAQDQQEPVRASFHALLTSQYAQFLQQQMQHNERFKSALRDGRGQPYAAARNRARDGFWDWRSWWEISEGTDGAGNTYAPPSSADEVARGVHAQNPLRGSRWEDMRQPADPDQYSMVSNSGRRVSTNPASTRTQERLLGWSLSAVGDELRRVFNDAPIGLDGERVANLELSRVEGSDGDGGSAGNSPSVAINIVFVLERKPLLSRAGDFFGRVRKALIHPLQEMADNVDDVLL